MFLYLETVYTKFNKAIVNVNNGFFNINRFFQLFLNNAFLVRYFDGRDWQIQWSEEATTLPELVEVTLASSTSGGATPVTESFIVNLKKARLRSTMQDLGQRQQQQQQQQGTPEPEGEQRQEQQINR